MDQARVASPSLNLRSSPAGPVLAVLHENDVVAITGVATGIWLPVSISLRSKIVAGFAASAYLARETPAPALKVATSVVPIPDDAAHPLTVSGNMAIAPGRDGTRFASVCRAGFYARGETELETYIAAQGTALVHTKSVLRVLAAVAQNEGPLEAVNSYDDAFLSAGFQQWTLGSDDDPGELAVLLGRLEVADAAAFADCFGRYKLGVKVTGRTGFLTLAGTPVATEAGKAQFRSKEWAYRFWRAGWHPSMRAAQVGMGSDRIGLARALPVLGHPAGEWLTSEQGVALLLDEHVNRPGHVSDTLEAAVKAVSAQSPAGWGNQEEVLLIRAYVDARADTNMTDPMGRANRIAAWVQAGKLSDARGSFVA
jgi:hypothetical protein